MVSLVKPDMSHLHFKTMPLKERIPPKVSESAEFESLSPFITFGCWLSYNLLPLLPDVITLFPKHACAWSLLAGLPMPSPRPSDFQSVQG